MTRKIRQFIRRIRPLVWLFNFLRYLVGLTSFVRDLSRFATLNNGAESRFSLSWQAPRLGDNTSGTEFDRHYVYHTAWAARMLAETKPVEHVDISSSLQFCSMVSAFIPMRFYDYRPADLRLDNLVSDHADILALPFADESVASLSCMHVVEHIGLGRYGDPLDPEGDLKAIAELMRVLAPGGNLLLVVPVGRPRIMFNAHRIYSFAQVRSYLENLKLIEFSLIPDNPEDGGLIRNATAEMADVQEYGCGCFLFRKA